jgi:hypothetical protein
MSFRRQFSKATFANSLHPKGFLNSFAAAMGPTHQVGWGMLLDPTQTMYIYNAFVWSGTTASAITPRVCSVNSRFTVITPLSSTDGHPA